MAAFGRLYPIPEMEATYGTTQLNGQDLPSPYLPANAYVSLDMNEKMGDPSATEPNLLKVT